MLTDCHCHPTDDPDYLINIRDLECRMALMSTRFDDLRLVAQQAEAYPDKVTPAFGLHPWYSHLLCIDRSIDKAAHFQSVLDPPPEPDDEILDHLPDPVFIDDHIDRIRQLLETHPNSLVGEVGLDRAFKVKVKNAITNFRVRLDHQSLVLKRQLELAAQLHRPVSLHGVQAHQALFEVVSPFCVGESRIAAVCLHSYGGSPDFFATHWRKRLGVKVFMSLAVLINGKRSPEKLRLLLKGADLESILSESDYHSAGKFQLDLVQQSVTVLSQQFNVSLEQMEAQLEKNYNLFIET